MSESTNNTENKNGKALLIAFIILSGIVVISAISVYALRGGDDSKSNDSSIDTSFDCSIASLTSYSQSATPSLNNISSSLTDDAGYTNQAIQTQLDEIKNEQNMIREEIAKKLAENQNMSNNEADIGYQLPRRLRNRLEPEYQRFVQHIQNNEIWQIEETQYAELLKKSNNKMAHVESDLQELYPGAASIVAGSRGGFSVKIPAGTRLMCVTEHAINSDHVGYFTATIRRPDALYGFQLIGEISSQQNNRIPTKAIAIVSKDGNRIELAENQVEMDFPGLTGNVKNHWAQRVIPNIASAALGSGAALYLLNSSTPEASTTNAGNISTRDLIAGPILESSVSSAQSEITRIGSDRPNTVLVQKGTTFKVLLVQGLELKI